MVKKFRPKDTLIFLSLFPYFQLFYACIFGINKHKVITVTVLTDFLILTSFYCVILLCLKYRKFTFCKIIGRFQNIYWVNFTYVFSVCIYLVLTKEPVKLYGSVPAIYAINPNFLYALMFIFMELFKLFMDVIFPEETNKEPEHPKSNTIELEELQSAINQNLKKTEPPPTKTETATIADNYNPTERETHLQAIATLSFELAKCKSVFATSIGKPKQATIAEILEKEAKVLFANPKSKDTYRKRLRARARIKMTIFLRDSGTRKKISRYIIVKTMGYIKKRVPLK